MAIKKDNLVPDNLDETKIPAQFFKFMDQQVPYHDFRDPDILADPNENPPAAKSRFEILKELQTALNTKGELLAQAVDAVDTGSREYVAGGNRNTPKESMRFGGAMSTLEDVMQKKLAPNSDAFTQLYRAVGALAQIVPHLKKAATLQRDRTDVVGVADMTGLLQDGEADEAVLKERQAEANELQRIANETRLEKAAAALQTFVDSFRTDLAKAVAMSAPTPAPKPQTEIGDWQVAGQQWGRGS